MKKKNIWIFLFLSAACALLLYFYSFTTSDAQQLYFTVTPEDSAGWEITGFQEGEEVPITAEEAVEGEKTAVLRRTVLNEWSNYGTVAVTDCREMCIFIEDELVYSNLDSPIVSIGELPKEECPTDALFSQVFFMNPAWCGKSITVLTRTFAGKPFASIPFDLLSSGVTAEQQTAWVSGQAIPGTIFGVFCLLFWGLFLYRLPAVKKALPLLLLAFAALLQMLYFLDRLKPVSILSPYDVVIQALYILMPLLYLSTQMGKERKWFLRIIVPIWAVYFASVASWAVFSLEVPMWFDKLAYLTLVLPAILVVFAVKIARTGNLYFRWLLKIMGLSVIGAVVIFASSALLNHSLFELFLIYWREMAAGYPFPLAFTLFTAILAIELLLAFVDLLESRVKAAQEVEALKLRNELTAQSLSSVEQTNKTLAMVRHDELHHLRTLSALCRENPLQAAEYAASLTKELETIPVMRFTGNSLVNAILSIESINAAKEGVLFEAKVKLPDALPFPDCDVSTVLMNLLGNAVEAAAKTPEGKERKVSAVLEMEEDTFFITIANSLPDSFDRSSFHDNVLNTPKNSNAVHGYGIPSVLSIVSHYDGKLRYTVQNDVITVNTVMVKR